MRIFAYAYLVKFKVCSLTTPGVVWKTADRVVLGEDIDTAIANIRKAYATDFIVEIQSVVNVGMLADSRDTFDA